jgi:hypothetical protein
MQTDHEECAVGNPAREFDHEGPAASKYTGAGLRFPSLVHVSRAVPRPP